MKSQQLDVTDFVFLFTLSLSHYMGRQRRFEKKKRDSPTRTVPASRKIKLKENGLKLVGTKRFIPILRTFSNNFFSIYLFQQHKKLYFSLPLAGYSSISLPKIDLSQFCACFPVSCFHHHSFSN